MEKPICVQKKPYVLDMSAGNYYYCTCGKSSKDPFCDGSHKGSEFRPKKVTCQDGEKVAWCGCKNSGNEERCDGTHAKL